MKEFAEYLRTLGMGDLLRERVATIQRTVKAICPEGLKYIFVSEYIQEDGSRQYEVLHFFSDNYAVEAKNFLTENMFEIEKIGHSIVNLLFDSQEFDLQLPTEKSRLRVRYYTATNLQADFKASRENCTHLLTIVQNCLIPNLKL